jgi:CBS domain-containing protein
VPRQPKALSEMTAEDVMTAPAAYVEVETPLREIARLMLKAGISAVPVVDQAGNLAGMVSESDLLRRNTGGQEPKRSWWVDLFEMRTRHSDGFLSYLERHGLRAKDVMTPEVISVGDDTRIVEIARLLETHAIKRVPVIRGGRLVGVVSRSDLLEALTHATSMHHRNTSPPRARRKRGLADSRVNASPDEAVSSVGAEPRRR